MSRKSLNSTSIKMNASSQPFKLVEIGSSHTGRRSANLSILTTALISQSLPIWFGIRHCDSDSTQGVCPLIWWVKIDLSDMRGLHTLSSSGTCILPLTSIIPELPFFCLSAGGGAWVAAFGAMKCPCGITCPKAVLVALNVAFMVRFCPLQTQALYCIQNEWPLPD